MPDEGQQEKRREKSEQGFHVESPQICLSVRGLLGREVKSCIF
jgi:hypothetical protein